MGAARAWSERLAAGVPAIVVPHAPLARGEVVVAAEAVVPEDRALVAEMLAASAPEPAIAR